MTRELDSPRRSSALSRSATVRPKELFRRLDSVTREIFEESEPHEVFERVAARLREAPGIDLGLENVLLSVHETAPVFPLELGHEHILIEAFRRWFLFEVRCKPSLTEEDVEFLVSTLHSVLAMRITERSMDSTMREAAEIQRSLLPQAPPALSGFDIAVRCQPTEQVGGDLYDFLPLGKDMLGLAVGDASGHGLPAALLVRDIVIGLRMGMERDLRPEHALARLNQVIHSSSLSSCFVSLLYAELECNGNLFYFNAGHEPPVLFDSRGATVLAGGDTVIGPLSGAGFRRRFAHVNHGATVLLYSDGILERRNEAGDLFGLDRLIETVSACLDQSARVIVDQIFEAVHDFGDSDSWEDDATVLIVQRR